MLKITTSILFLFGALYGDSKIAPEGKEPYVDSGDSKYETVIFANHPLTLEEYVRLYYREAPVLAEIARCESQFRHTKANGEVIRGEIAREDVGVMQINEFYHEKRAKELGLDLYSLDGNLAYAKRLYEREGTLPWNASERCWEKYDTLAQTKRATQTAN